MTYKLTEIINQEQIESILEEFEGEKQLQELKDYLMVYYRELKEIGVDPSTFAWQIYNTNKKPKRK